MAAMVMYKGAMVSRRWPSRYEVQEHKTYLKVPESSRSAYLFRSATLTLASSLRRTIRSQMTTSFFTYEKTRSNQSARDPRRCSKKNFWTKKRKKKEKTRLCYHSSENGNGDAEICPSSFLCHSTRWGIDLLLVHSRIRLPGTRRAALYSSGKAVLSLRKKGYHKISLAMHGH